MNINRKQRIGRRYGRLVVIGVAGFYVSPKGEKHTRFFCKCDCGGTAIKNRSALVGPKVAGCPECHSVRKSEQMTIHGGSKGKRLGGRKTWRLFDIWRGMNQRCRNKNRKGAENYVLRGISVCDEWQDFSIFRDWALSHGYADNLTIERNDVNGNYKPSNCQWIPLEKQNKNKRITRYIDVRGTMMIAADAERFIGVPLATIKNYHKNHKITHQEAFDHLFARQVLKAVNAEKMAA